MSQFPGVSMLISTLKPSEWSGLWRECKETGKGSHPGRKLDNIWRFLKALFFWGGGGECTMVLRPFNVYFRILNVIFSYHKYVFYRPNVTTLSN